MKFNFNPVFRARGIPDRIMNHSFKDEIERYPRLADEKEFEDPMYKEYEDRKNERMENWKKDKLGIPWSDESSNLIICKNAVDLIEKEYGEGMASRPWSAADSINKEFREKHGQIYEQIIGRVKRGESNNPIFQGLTDEERSPWVGGMSNSLRNKIIKFKGENKMYNTINIEEVNNGFILTVGCQKFIAKNKKELISGLTEYINDPEKAEEKYCKGNNDE